jgi:hypothetical protein
MAIAIRKQTADPLQETGAFYQDAGTDEEAPLLLIDELEPRLTPDSPFGSSPNNNQPPSGQVGWGC